VEDKKRKKEKEKRVIDVIAGRSDEKQWEFSLIDGGLFFPGAEVEEGVIKE